MSEDKITNEDIAALPTVSQGEIDRVNRIKAEKPPTKEEVATEEFDHETDERNQRLLQDGLTRAFKKLTGEEVKDDQVSAFAELSAIVFGGLRKVSFGKGIGILITSVCILSPFAPPIYKIFKSMRNKEQPQQEQGVKNNG